jgi:CarD family transcriptional regulator
MELQFRVGDKAVYPAQGVAEIVGIEEKEIGGIRTSFYVLKILDSEMKIMVPKAKATQVGLRQVAGKAEIAEVMAILKAKELHVDKQTWNRRYRGFMEKIKTGSLYEVAEVYRDLSRLKNTKTLSFGERRMLDTARNLIVKELSVAKNAPESRVEHELESLFS